jgi:hypothetical protein
VAQCHQASVWVLDDSGGLKSAHISKRVVPSGCIQIVPEMDSFKSVHFWGLNAIRMDPIV